MQSLAPILIAGPTASGKSQLAMALARACGGCIINADSMQVYRELSILTARPSPQDEAEIAHKLYGHVPAGEAYSVGRYVEDASEAIKQAQAQGLRPIITGGTGLYFKALLEGLSPIPKISDEVRRHWRSEGERLGPVALHYVLAQRDAVMAGRLEPSDTQRIVRALEVLEETGRSLADWQTVPGEPVVAGSVVKLLVTRDRGDLHGRADRRFDQMVAQGALEEAARIANLGLPPDLPAMRALGLAPLIAAVRDEISFSEATERSKLETRQYIKRQETWSRRYMISWKSLSTQEMESNAADCFSFIDL